MVGFRRSFGSIRGRLVLLLIVVFSLILVLQAIYHFNRFRAQRLQEYRTNLEVARATAAAFDQFLRDILHQEQAIGINLTTPRLHSVKVMNQVLAKNCAEYATLRNIAWVGPQGRITASSLESAIGLDVSDRDYFGKILSGAQWHVMDLHASKITGEPVFSIARGIRDDAGDLLGIVVAVVLPDKLAEELSVERAGGGGITVIDRNSRAVLRYPIAAWSWEERSIPKDRPEPAEILAGKEHAGVYVCFRDGTERIVGLAPVRAIGWAVAAGRPLDEVLAPLKRQLALEAVLLFLLTLGVFAVALAISRGIEQPVRKLREHALALAGGDFSSSMETTGPSELKDLTFAFNSMAGKVRKREETLEAARLRLFSVLEAMPAFIFLEAPDYSIRYANEPFRKFFGDPEGKTCYEILHNREEPCEECSMLDVIESNRPREWEVTNPNGCTHRMHKCLFHDIDGSPLVLTVGIDVSERISAEDAVRKSEASYRTLAENLPAMVYRVSLREKGKTDFFNDTVEELTGFNPEDLPRGDICAIAPLIVPEDRTRVLETMRRAVEENRPFEVEYRILTKSGSIVHVQERGRPIHGADGEPLCIDGVIFDITKRKQAEEALQESESRLRSLSSRLISAQEEERKRLAGELHDSIGAALGAIKFSLENTLHRMREGKAAPDALEVLVSMTNQTMDEARRIYMDLRPSILDDLGIVVTIGWFARQFQAVYSAIHVDTRIRVEEEDVPEGLKIIIFRIIQEAMNNIAKYSGADRIEVSLVKQDGRIDLTVKDNGKGFDLNSTHTRKDGKGGLGLTSMRERAESLKGALTIETAVGEGTVVRASWDASTM